MLRRTSIEKLDDYFIDLGKRKNKGIYFYRINGYNCQIHEFIQRYYETARLSGVIIEGKLQNPDTNNLAYYNEIMGNDFQMSMGFMMSSLKKWLPRMNDSQRENVAGSIYDTLMGLKRAGKNDNMLKNAYIKFMCWLYYKFERIANHLGDEKLPKILYEGTISTYELLLMNVLAIAGCDIVLLQYQGDAAYQKIDPDSTKSIDLKLPGMNTFPPSFSLKQIRADIQETQNSERLYGPKPQFSNCTNAWITGKVFEDVRKDTLSRGEKPNFFYNCYCRIMGVEDRLTYQNDLFQLQLELKNRKRHVVIVNNTIDPPTIEEINEIHRKIYQNVNQLIIDLATNIRYSASQELQRIMHKAFVDIILEESKQPNMNMNRLTGKAVYVLCWLKRYQQRLFNNWKPPEVACFFFMGGCRNENEALFCKLLARLPVDVLIFNPNLDRKCCLEDKLLYEVNNSISMTVTKYPEENIDLRVGTAAYQAERDLDTLMYQDTGIYRNQQYLKANTVSLQTMYEEISILWDQELKYRPNFSVIDDTVNMPVIFSKICGVKDGMLSAYWSGIKNLLTPDTTVITNVPKITSTSPNPIKASATEFLKNGRLQKRKIKSHKAYQYGFLREPMQDYLLDKLQMLIEQRIIKGTFENGTEYTIISTALNLEKEVLRMIQKFDFTKKNPKIIYIITGETGLSLEDTIYTTFLNLIGFDILFFVPTGYQCIERYLSKNIIEEHQIGEYLYDLQIPNFDAISSSTTRSSWRDIIFKRGT